MRAMRSMMFCMAARVCHEVDSSVSDIRNTSNDTLGQAHAANLASIQLVEQCQKLEALLKTYRW